MPRKARLDAPGTLHHIIVRGINKTPIFKDDLDKALFLERLGKNVVQGRCTIRAWVLMTNHVHLLFKSGEDGISTVMRKQLTWYAQYFNRRHGRTGHLFENRYKSILCDEEAYLLALTRYIHSPLRTWDERSKASMISPYGDIPTTKWPLLNELRDKEEEWLRNNKGWGGK